jgi:uncharacterized membrane protein YgaE (UPF0421/DUF939 family)
MEDRTRWLLYETAVMGLAFFAGVAPLVAIYSHLWLGAADGGPAGVGGLSGFVAMERSRVETLRLAGAVATAVAVGGLAALAPGYAGFADDLRQEIRTGVALGVAVVVAGGVLSLVGPGLAVEALGLTLLGYGLLAVVTGSTYLALTGPD